jgi:hypothetical protein
VRGAAMWTPSCQPPLELRAAPEYTAVSRIGRP